MKSIISAVNNSHLRPVATYLGRLASIVGELTDVLENVRTDCDPATSFNRIRVWFPGGKSAFDLDDGESVEEEWMGPSAAQGSIRSPSPGRNIHGHRTADPQPAGKIRCAAIRRRLYLPANHRVFIEELNRFGQQMRTFILDHPDRERAAQTIITE